MDFKNAIAASKFVSCSFFFLLLFTLHLSSVLAARNSPLPKSVKYHVVNLTSLQPKSYCESHTTGLGSERIRMASRNGPCSHGNHGKTVSSFSVLNENSQNKEGISNDDVSSTGFMEYLVTIGLGEPTTNYTLLVDTGSDNTWVRCKPCITGCDSTDPLFDPSKSSTYKNGSCRSNDGDEFSSSYADNSKSTGHWGCDNLIISKSYGVKMFQFGCGQENIDGANDNFDDHAGILGLGQGDLSLASQGGPKFGKFSYCLPKTDSQVGYLVFGSEVTLKSSSSNPKFTPLLPPPSNLPEKYIGKSYYFIELLGISVAGKQLNVFPSIFASPGTIIDSGTSITMLPREAYSALSSAFNESMVNSKYSPALPQQNMDTCYNVEGIDTNEVTNIPDITFHFRGADVVLMPSGILFSPLDNKNVVCLGFTRSDDLTVIGNHQQREIGMFFDLQGKRIGFGTKNCVG